MKISAIFSATKNMAVGVKNGGLVVKSKIDLSWFRGKTLDRTVIVGRKTFESLPKRLDRRNVIVVSSTMEKIEYPNHTIARSLSEAIEQASHIELKEVIIIGGVDLIFEAVTNFNVDNVYYTEFDIDYPCTENIIVFDKVNHMMSRYRAEKSEYSCEYADASVYNSSDNEWEEVKDVKHTFSTFTKVG